jgi:hypothetical protein
MAKRLWGSEIRSSYKGINETGEAVIQIGDFALSGVINEYYPGRVGSTRPRPPATDRLMADKLWKKHQLPRKIPSSPRVLRLLVPSN